MADFDVGGARSQRPRCGGMRSLMPLSSMHAQAGQAVSCVDVADHNQQAIALYARKGFKPNSKTGALPAPRNHIP